MRPSGLNSLFIGLLRDPLACGHADLTVVWPSAADLRPPNAATIGPAVMCAGLAPDQPGSGLLPVRQSRVSRSRTLETGLCGCGSPESASTNNDLLGGSDFRDAQFSIAVGRMLRTDVEIHIEAVNMTVGCRQLGASP